MNIGQLAMRGVVGPLFVGHGTQKLFGWFEAPAEAGTPRTDEDRTAEGRFAAAAERAEAPTA